MNFQIYLNFGFEPGGFSLAENQKKSICDRRILNLSSRLVACSQTVHSLTLINVGLAYWMEGEAVLREMGLYEPPLVQPL